MDEKQMTLGELVRWLDNNDVPYEVDGTEKLTVKGDLTEDFRDWVGACKYTSLPDELICVDGNLWLEQTSIMSLGGLTSVGGWLHLEGTVITSLGRLASVGGDLYLQNTPITSLGNLTSVGRGLYLSDTSTASLGNLTFVGGDLDLKGTPITSLGNLTSVEWNLTLQDTSITSLDDLPQVGGDLHLDQGQLQLLTEDVLQKVKGSILNRGQATEEGWLTWVTLSPAELETVVAENEQREKLNNTRENDVDWDLYDR